MKLNLLIFSLLGVSVSASGIRGFTPIKGSERRLASSTKKTEKSGKDTTFELVSSTGRVINCSGKLCERFFKHCTDDGDDGLFRGVRNFSGLTSSDSGSGNSRRLKKTSSSSDDDVAVFRVGDVESCEIERTRGGGSSSSSSSTGSSSSSSSDTGAAKKEKTSSSSTSKDTGAAKKETTSKKKREATDGSSSSKSPKLRRVLHSSSSSSKKGEKADTRIEFTSRGGLVSCSGKNCKKFIKRCTDGKKHLKNFDLRTFFDGSTTKSTGKSRLLKKSDDNDNIYIRFINMNDVDVDANGCFLV